MKRFFMLFSAMAVVSAVPALARLADDKTATKPEDAQVLLNAAKAKSKGQKKPVFVMFDASW